MNRKPAHTRFREYVMAAGERGVIAEPPPVLLGQPNPDPLRPDEDPRVPRHDPPPPARSFLGCRWWVALAVTIAIAVLLIAAPDAAPQTQEGGGYLDGRSNPEPVLTTLPAVPSGASADRPVGAEGPSVGSNPTTGNDSESMPAPTPTPEPTGAVSGSYTATATWCAPTPTQCQSWGGDAKLAAVNSFTWGDEPYLVRVWRGSRSVVVRVVSFCACAGNDQAIDLSQSAFRQLASLSRGRINVVVEDLSGVVVPATDSEVEP